MPDFVKTETDDEDSSDDEYGFTDNDTESDSVDDNDARPDYDSDADSIDSIAHLGLDDDTYDDLNDTYVPTDSGEDDGDDEYNGDDESDGEV
ncbi:hypothetical protein U1Q18_050365 [Sarracenia purpurea var. burkii]